MNSQKTPMTTSSNQLCKECNLFFGCETFKGYCSSCFKKNQVQQLENQVEKKAEPLTKTKICRVQFIREINGKQYVVSKKNQKVQVDRSKCFSCSKKVGLLGVECKCKFMFCNLHRLPEDHCCEVNYKEEGKIKLEKQLANLGNEKIKRI